MVSKDMEDRDSVDDPILNWAGHTLPQLDQLRQPGFQSQHNIL